MTSEESANARRGLLDTSVFIAEETERPIGVLPQFGCVSVVTLAELSLGVLTATDPEMRGTRLHTLTRLETMFEVLPIDTAVARVFAEIVAEARRQGKRPKVMEVWIAATGVAHGLPPRNARRNRRRHRTRRARDRHHTPRPGHGNPRLCLCVGSLVLDRDLTLAARVRARWHMRRRSPCRRMARRRNTVRSMARARTRCDLAALA